MGKSSARPSPQTKKHRQSKVQKVGVSNTGADSRTRTGEPILTMDVLYLLS